MPAEREDFPIARLAALARLRLPPADASLFGTQLAHVLEFVGQVAAADFDSPASSAHPEQPTAAERPDSVSPSLTADAALANAPDASNAPRLVRVPRVIG
jgi:aspartyl-tRNA(Asn)/glutamyl-tRNA(Gln) amidotransferase subunit C